MLGPVRIEVALPGEEIPIDYFETRYQCLRMPLGFERGSEVLEDDNSAIHAWVSLRGQVVSVGRAHLIARDSCGATADHQGEGAAICPSFSPLADENESLRPAFHIRQMGTLEGYQNNGFAKLVLQALEEHCQQIWACKTGWLQARENAIEFYRSCGWSSFGEEYDIAGIGTHLSMKKQFIKTQQ